MLERRHSIGAIVSKDVFRAPLFDCKHNDRAGNRPRNLTRDKASGRFRASTLCSAIVWNQ